MSFVHENDGDLELEPDGEQYCVLYQGHMIGSITYQSSEDKRWTCACEKHFRTRKGILAHIRCEHLGLPHPLGTRPAVSTGPSQAALYKLAGAHSDPTYEQAIFNICNPHLALV